MIRASSISIVRHKTKHFQGILPISMEFAALMRSCDSIDSTGLGGAVWIAYDGDS